MSDGIEPVVVGFLVFFRVVWEVWVCWMGWGGLGGLMGGGSNEAGGLRCRLCACDAVGGGGGGCCLACYGINLGLL